MLDNIINLVKKEAADLILNNPDVPEEKKEETVQTTTSTLINGIKDNLTPSNISEVMNLFGNSSVEASRNNNVANNIQSSVISSLIQKVGLSPQVANSIATAIIPTVMSLLSQKISNDKEPGFNLNSVLGALTGNSTGQNNSNILNSLGKLFSK